MDAAKFKQTTVSRGYKYSYYRVAGDGAKPTVLLLHGFPSDASDWAGIVPPLEAAGYGLIVPDMLGYRGTDKPTDPAEYMGSKIGRDLVDILDAEGVDAAVAIGHDWGSTLAGKLNGFFPTRFLAFGFLAVGYLPPQTEFDPIAGVKAVEQLLGYVPWGYWEYFADDTSAKTIETNMDSFLELIYPADVNFHKEHFCPPGATKAWIESNSRGSLLSTPVATPAWADALKNVLLKGGLAAPTCYYKVFYRGMSSEDDKGIPLENYDLKTPVFLGLCTYDAPCPVKWADTMIQPFLKGPFTRKEYDSAHWVTLTHYESLSKDLLDWLATVKT